MSAEAADPDWHTGALCAQVAGDLWFPDAGESGKEAKAICGRCPVAAPCLQWALANDQFAGIYGGLTAKERARLRARPARTCQSCGTPVAGWYAERCPPCRDAAVARSHAKNDSLRHGGTYTENFHPWQSRPRPHLQHRDDGTGGPAVAARGGPDLHVTHPDGGHR